MSPLDKSGNSPWLTLRAVLCAGVWLALGAGVQALDYSVPYVRKDLPYFGVDGIAGYGAIVGLLEVRGEEGNGIDGVDGHRQSGLGPNPGDFYYGTFGFKDVQDFSGQNDPADHNFHGTFVAGVMASEYISVTTDTGTYPFLGMAPLALYYGAVFNGAGTKESFLTLNASLHYLAVDSGASVINHSWGAEPDNASQLDGSSFSESLLMDEYAGYEGKKGGTTGAYLDKLMVIAAGNSGETSGLLGAPADSFNGLTVGALSVINPQANGLDDPNRMPAPVVASYSSWRPLADGRGGVDVVAPGTNIWSTVAIDYFNQNDLIAGAASGTSFATPHVTGEAALLYGAVQTLGYFSDKGSFLFTDHKLIKALIINSADKIPGLDADGIAQSVWQPGLMSVIDGVPTSLVPLNYAVGAGSANAKEAYLQLRESGNRFWDVHTFAGTDLDYYYVFGSDKFFDSDPTHPFLFNLTATLVWDRHVDFVIDSDLANSLLGSVTKDLLSNLDLILQVEISPGVWQDVYRSAGTLDNLEHIYLPELAEAGNYRLDVHVTDMAEPDLGETYALAVSYNTLPEPGGWCALFLGAIVGIARHRPVRVRLKSAARL